MNITDLFWLAYTLYLEARGEVINGQKAVAKVILNRSNGSNIQQTVLKPKQFSCFNDCSRPSISDTRSFLICLQSATDSYREWKSGDTLGGARYYYNPSLCTPTWAKDMILVAEIGNHKFLKSTT
jgi:N-acetylmuramoyl-L-alanine amidase